MKYYSAIEMKEILVFILIYVNHKDIMLSEKIQIEKKYSA